MRSTRTTHLPKPLALTLAVAALAVPMAQAKLTPVNGTLDRNDAVHFPAPASSVDPAIAAAIRSHVRGQNGVSRSAAATAPAAAPNGFDWGAAGIGATVALAAMLLGLGVARLIPRRSRARLA